jgi:hypothetical protein
MESTSTLIGWVQNSVESFKESFNEEYAYESPFYIKTARGIATNDYVIQGDYTYPRPHLFDNVCYMKHIILENTIKEIDRSEVDEMTLRFAEHVVEHGDIASYNFFKVSLAKILKVCPSNLVEFSKPPSMTFEEECNIANDMFGQYDSRDIDKIIQKYGLARIECDRIHSDWETLTVNDVDNHFFFDVNSYDLHNPASPFPCKLDLRHDGTIMILLCEDENGKQFIQRVWGD